jgi:hypothetical protein
MEGVSAKGWKKLVSVNARRFGGLLIWFTTQNIIWCGHPNIGNGLREEIKKRRLKGYLGKSRSIIHKYFLIILF